MGWHCQLFEERRHDPRIRALEDHGLTPGEAAFVRETGRPSSSDYDRTLVVPGSVFHTAALSAVKDIEDKEAEAKHREQ